jgi:hypothetical protein
MAPVMCPLPHPADGPRSQNHRMRIAPSTAEIRALYAASRAYAKPVGSRGLEQDVAYRGARQGGETRFGGEWL